MDVLTTYQYNDSFVTATTLSEIPNSPPKMCLVFLIVYSVICAVGVLGNFLVLYIMIKMTKGMSVTDLYVTNLAIADVLLLILLPLYAAEMATDEWNFGPVLCKVSSCLTYISMYASIYFLALMSFDRWLAVVKAIKSRILRNLRNARIVCGTIWLIVALPFIIMPGLYRDVKNRNGRKKCSWDLSPEMYNIFVLTRTIGGFIIPLSIIAYCYVDILRFMQKQRSRMNKLKNNTKDQNKLVGMIFIVIAFFLICWLPNQIATVLQYLGLLSPSCHDITPTNKTFINENSSNSMYTATTQTSTFIEDCYKSQQTAFFIHVSTVCLGFSNSMLNPIIYSFMSARFRDKLFIILRVKRNHHVDNFTHVTFFRKATNNGKSQDNTALSTPNFNNDKIVKRLDRDQKNVQGIFPDYLQAALRGDIELKEKQKENNKLLVEEVVQSGSLTRKLFKTRQKQETNFSTVSLAVDKNTRKEKV